MAAEATASDASTAGRRSVALALMQMVVPSEEALLTTRNRLVSDAAHTVGEFASGKHRYTHRDLMDPPIMSKL